MEKLKRNFDLLLTLIMLVAGWGGWLLMNKVFPDNYFELYPVIPSLFYLFGLIFIRVLYKADKTNPRKLVNLYMLIRFAKVGICLLVVGVYYVVNKEYIREFSLVFMVFYIIYLVFETLYYSQLERIIKKNTEHE